MLDLAAYSKFVWPLCRLLFGLACGLLLANLLEALRWTDHLAKLARPLARFAHLGQTAASAFGLAFVSPAGANSLLSEAYEQKRLSFSELMLANLFNGLPAYLSHIPTIFLLMWPVLGMAAAAYAGVTLLAAVCRTVFTIFLARLLLSPLPTLKEPEIAPRQSEAIGRRLALALRKAWQRFCKRIVKLVLYTAPIYALMCIGQEYGFFTFVESWLAVHLDWLAVIKPQAMGIIALQLMAEIGATLGAAGAVLQDGSLSSHDVVLALLVGNVLATPLRALRHQLPAYAGFYRPKLAVKLVVANQALRATSMVIVIAAYYLLTK